MDQAFLMAECLAELRRRGFTPPFYFAAIGVNGTAVVGMFVADGQGGLRAQIGGAWPTGELLAPVNIMFSDARGEAARVVLLADEQGMAPKWMN